MYTQSGTESIQHANRNGYSVDIAEADELQLDLDTDEQYATFERMLPHVADVYPIEDIIETQSKSGKRHVRLFTACGLSIEERVALQAILGSDPKKELCSLRRWLNNDPVPILLFEKSETFDQIQKAKNRKKSI